ncbi:hypothetical protein [Microcoleus sp. M2_B4]|uniref:hypothetical protein n=1 Tax=Microcoleus sp. M2_B4 TaxID=2818826 RepID=UPI002FD4758B
MLYKGHSIVIWKSEWVGRVICGEYYILHSSYYHDMRGRGEDNKYIAIIDEINPQRGCQIWGGSTPKIALDLARFAIHLKLTNHRRWDVEQRFRGSDTKCLREYYAKLSGNT